MRMTQLRRKSFNIVTSVLLQTQTAELRVAAALCVIHGQGFTCHRAQVRFAAPDGRGVGLVVWWVQVVKDWSERSLETTSFYGNSHTPLLPLLPNSGLTGRSTPLPKAAWARLSPPVITSVCYLRSLIAGSFTFPARGGAFMSFMSAPVSLRHL